MKNKKLPRISFVVRKNKENIFFYPTTIRKAKKFLRNKAKSYLKKGFTITIKVTYGFGINVFGKKSLFQNSGTYSDIKSFKWAFQAFVKD